MYVWELKTGMGSFTEELIVGGRTLGEALEYVDDRAMITAVRCLGELHLTEDLYAALASELLLVPHVDCELVAGRIKALLKELREPREMSSGFSKLSDDDPA